MIKLADAEPVIVSSGLEDGFKISARALETAITDRTRLMFLNSPSNPTGAAYTRQELQGLGKCCGATRISSLPPMTCMSTFTGHGSRL
jgi:aspartate aminotransferase